MSDPFPPPTWQPISQLPVIAWAITGMAESATEQRGHLRQAEDRPHVLDNQTVDRVIASSTQQQSDLWLYAEQLTRWQALSLTSAQRAEVVACEERLATLRTTITTILDLAAYLRLHTIETLLAMSDDELGLAVVLGTVAPPRRRTKP